jgi:hypothetical protein
MGGVCENNVNNSLPNVNKLLRVVRQRIFKTFFLSRHARFSHARFNLSPRDNLLHVRDDFVNVGKPSRPLVAAR